MVDFNYFTPLIGKRFGSPEFEAAMQLLGREAGNDLSYKLIDALPPKECAADDPLKRVFKNERILVISSGETILAIYLASAPYKGKADKYPNGDVPYIIPRYHLTKDFDTQLNSFSLYYLSITAYRYLRVISSFYKESSGSRINLDSDAIFDLTKIPFRKKLNLRDFYSPNADDSQELSELKSECKKRYKKLADHITKIIIRRAQPYTTTTINEVIGKALTPMTDELANRITQKTPINGPNDEMELTIRYLIVALKLTVADFKKQNNINVVTKSYEADSKEFELLTNYLMVVGQFQNKESDGLIKAPDLAGLKEFSFITREIHGEVAKISYLSRFQEGEKLTKAQAQAFLDGEYGHVKLSPEQQRLFDAGKFGDLKLNTEQAGALRTEYASSFMLHNRIQKITRCAYNVDLCKDTVLSCVQENPDIAGLVQKVSDLAKVKIFTSVASERNYSRAYQEYTAAANELQIVSRNSESLRRRGKNVIMTFVDEVDAMSEIKRDKAGAVGKIEKQAGTPWTQRTSPGASSIFPEGIN